MGSQYLKERGMQTLRQERLLGYLTWHVVFHTLQNLGRMQSWPQDKQIFQQDSFEGIKNWTSCCFPCLWSCSHCYKFTSSQACSHFPTPQLLLSFSSLCLETEEASPSPFQSSAIWSSLHLCYRPINPDRIAYFCSKAKANLVHVSKVPLSSSWRVILFPELKQVRHAYSKTYRSLLSPEAHFDSCLLIVNQGNPFLAEALIVSFLSRSKDPRTPGRVTRTASSLFRSFLPSSGNPEGKKKKHIWEATGQITCLHTPAAHYAHHTILGQLLTEM